MDCRNSRIELLGVVKNCGREVTFQCTIIYRNLQNDELVFFIDYSSNQETSKKNGSEAEWQLRSKCSSSYSNILKASIASRILTTTGGRAPTNWCGTISMMENPGFPAWVNFTLVRQRSLAELKNERGWATRISSA